MKPFGCEFCGATFRVEKYLIQHLHSTHSGSKTESELTSCPLCEEAFIGNFLLISSNFAVNNCIIEFEEAKLLKFCLCDLQLHLLLQCHLTYTNICWSTRMRKIVFARSVAKHLCTNLIWHTIRSFMIMDAKRETVTCVVESKYITYCFVHRKGG